MTSARKRRRSGATLPGTIAHFEILGRLGAGGMGVVYRARDQVLEREVALKLIRPHAAGDAEVQHRFLREARLAGAINHPGVATLYEAGEVQQDGAGDQQLYLASELVEGRSLEEILRDGPLPVDRVIDLGIQLAGALEAAHQIGIVHRDIKPSNLMVSEDGRLKVLDFGVAKRVAWAEETAETAETLTFTARGAVVGTPAYMAPEQAAGGAADTRTDVHGAGCVLYQMLTGRGPFGTGTPSDVMRRVIVTPPEPLRTLRVEVPRALAEVVEKALAKDPADRYQTASELGDALRAAASATGRVRALHGLVSVFSRKTAVAIAAIGAVAFALVVGSRVLGPSMPFESRDWLLVADVVNDTGDEGFTLALKSALETDLRQSRHVNVFDSGQVRNTLKLMRREVDQDLDLDNALEVCRFAGVRALLVPEIHALGDVYILQASLIEPSTGRTADSIRLTADGRDEVLLESIDRLTHRVRRRLGESLRSIEDTDPPLVQYTTSSWEAQQLLALGSKEWAESRPAQAARCFERALEEDPEFAMARGSLGLLEIQYLDRPEEGVENLRRALADASQVSRREYLLLRAVNRQFVDDDPEEALADYRLISELYPDAMQPLNNSGRILERLGRYEEAVRMYERAHEVDPRSPFPLWNLWSLHLQRLRQPMLALADARALVDLQPEAPWPRHGLAWSLISLRRFDEAEAEMREVLVLDPNHSFARANLAHLLYRRGAFAEAVAIYREIHSRSHASDEISTDLHDSLCLGLALRGAGDADEARTVLEGGLEAAEAIAAAGEEPARRIVLLAALGRNREARRRAVELQNRTDLEPFRYLALAEALTLIGDFEPAVSALEAAFEAGFDDPYFILIDPPLRDLEGRDGIGRIALF